MEQQNKRIQLFSHFTIFDSPASRSTKNMEPSRPRQSKRVTAAKQLVRDCIGKIIPKIRRPVKYDEDTQFTSGTTTATIQSPANSTDDCQRSVVLLDREVLPHHKSLSSTSSSQSNESSHQQDKLSLSVAQTYQILPQITGHGIAGEVRTCIHRTTRELCVVKTISKDRIRRQDRIQREIAFLKQVHHPNIISMYDVYDDKEEVNIVMEMCHGGELFDKIIEKAKLGKVSKSGGAIGNQRIPSCFREKDAARIIHSLLSAISYLHSKDIVHRDIKPENILFIEKDNDESPIKLIDFGLSTRHPRQSKPLTTSVGTSYYMAPELLDGSYDRSCDMWSIGVVTYVMLSGRPPFGGPTDHIIFKKILRGLDVYKMETSSLWNGVSKYAKDFIRCLLDMDPTRRWTVDQALEHPWLKVARLDAQSESRPAEPKRTVSC